MDGLTASPFLEFPANLDSAALMNGVYQFSVFRP